VTPKELSAFREFANLCINNHQLLAEFDRLNGTNLCGHGTPIQLAVDHATNRLEHEAAKFLEFVLDLWERM
jgi:hypothetical protein